MNAERTAALATRLQDARLAERELQSVEHGRRRGLYEVLADSGPITADEFAPLAGISQVVAAQWLEQQAAAGLLDVTRPGTDRTREYLLPGEHLTLLLADEHPFRRNGVVDEVREWVSALPFVSEALAAGGAILDAGPGEGWSTLALAQAFPQAPVVAADPDDDAVLAARAAATAAGLDERIAFLEAQLDDAATLRPWLPDGAALATVFDTLMGARDPIGALTAFRTLLSPRGTVLVAIPLLPDEFAAPADALGRRAYVEGRVLRAPRLQEWAAATGFRAVELPIPHEQWRWFRLDPV